MPPATDDQPSRQRMCLYRDVYAVAFTPDGTRLLSGGHDEVVKIWDVRSGLEIGP